MIRGDSCSQALPGNIRHGLLCRRRTRRSLVTSWKSRRIVISDFSGLARLAGPSVSKCPSKWKSKQMNSTAGTAAPGLEYLERCREMIGIVAAQRRRIAQAADWFAADHPRRPHGARLRLGPQPHHGGGNVAALRLVPRVQPDRRAVAELPQSGRRRQRPAAGHVSGKCLRPGRAHPAQLRPVAAADSALVDLLQRLQRRAHRNGGTVSKAAASKWSPSSAGGTREASPSRPSGKARSCKTSPISCSIPARRSATPWCASPGSKRRSRRARPSAAAC